MNAQYASKTSLNIVKKNIRSVEATLATLSRATERSETFLRIVDSDT